MMVARRRLVMGSDASTSMPCLKLPLIGVLHQDLPDERRSGYALRTADQIDA